MNRYVPYIADYFIEQNNTALMDVRGAMMYDPSINVDIILEDSKYRNASSPIHLCAASLTMIFPRNHGSISVTKFAA